MRPPLTAQEIHPRELTPGHEALWAQFRALDPRLAHPYFDVRFTQAAADVPGGAVAILARGDRVVGFFPLQRRRNLVQPLAAPMSDYHGVIAAPGEKISPQALIGAIGGALSADAWAGATVPGFQRRERMATRIEGGAAALQSRLEAKNRKFWKNMKRKARRLEEEVGPTRFTWDDCAPETLDWLIAAKRAQYARTRRHDIFACGWTLDLLTALRERHGEGFGLRIASLRTAKGELMAAEASLDDNRTLHLWFPVYDPIYRRYGPGMYLTWLQLKNASDEGYIEVDFGCGDGDYKATLADVAGYVWRGSTVSDRPTRTALVRLFDRRAPKRLRRLGASMSRRLDVINACETSPAGWMTGAASAGWAMINRRNTGTAS